MIKGRFVLGLVAGLIACPAYAAPITLSNAIATVDVNGGEAGNGLVPYDGYFRYTDIGTGEETTWSIDPVLIPVAGAPIVLSNGAAGGFGSPSDLGGGVVESSAIAAGVFISATTTLMGPTAKTVFSFLSMSDMTGMTFLFYAENDLFGFADDVAAFTGSIAGGDLALYQYDSAAGGLSVKLDGVGVYGATLASFGSGLWTGFGTALESGDLSSLSSDGSTFVTLGDLGLALAFSLSGTEAAIEINYSTVPEPPVVGPAVPEPASMMMCAVGALGLFSGRRLLRRRAA